MYPCINLGFPKDAIEIINYLNFKFLEDPLSSFDLEASKLVDRILEKGDLALFLYYKNIY